MLMIYVHSRFCIPTTIGLLIVKTGNVFMSCHVILHSTKNYSNRGYMLF